jgi:hypothetical protein
MNEKHARIICYLRWIANRDDIDHNICYDCDDAADVIELTCKLIDAIDRAAELGKLPDDPICNDIRAKREALR